MSENRKLYEVKVELTYYAYTETPDAAEDFARDAIDDAFLSDITRAREIKHRGVRLTGEWDDDNLVYCVGSDVTLGEVLATLPEKEPPRG